MKRLLFILIASMYALAACNTMEGAGKDIQKAGEKVEDAAQKKK